MLIGYARVSTRAQDLDPQEAALREAGCEKVYVEKISGAAADRPQLAALLEFARAGDVVVVTRLDRLGRSTRQMLETVEWLESRKVNLRSLAEPWADTTSPAGRVVMTVFAGIAEFERSLILARTREGRANAKANGKKFGRKPKVNEDQWSLHRGALRRGEITVSKAAELLGGRVGRAATSLMPPSLGPPPRSLLPQAAGQGPARRS